jgi:hypothetical protein
MRLLPQADGGLMKESVMQAMHPTKEQIRAYMHLREFDRRPPPTPDEIRRQLGWHGDSVYPESLAGSSLLLPSAIAQLAALLAVEWCFRAAGFCLNR